jgi:hypothetical protein
MIRTAGTEFLSINTTVKSLTRISRSIQLTRRSLTRESVQKHWNHWWFCQLSQDSLAYVNTGSIIFDDTVANRSSGKSIAKLNGPWITNYKYSPSRNWSNGITTNIFTWHYIYTSIQYVTTRLLVTYFKSKQVINRFVDYLTTLSVSRIHSVTC